MAVATDSGSAAPGCGGGGDGQGGGGAEAPGDRDVRADGDGEVGRCRRRRWPPGRPGGTSRPPVPHPPPPSGRSAWRRAPHRPGRSGRGRGARVSNPGPRFADDAGTRARTSTTYPQRPAGTGTAPSACREHDRRRPVGGAPVGRLTTGRSRGDRHPAVPEAPPHRRLGHGLAQLQRDGLELRADGVDRGARRGSRPRCPGPRAERRLRAHVWPGQPGSQASVGRHVGGRVGLARPRWPSRSPPASRGRHRDLGDPGLGGRQESFRHRAGVLERVGDGQIVDGDRRRGGRRRPAAGWWWSSSGRSGASPPLGPSSWWWRWTGGRGGRRLRDRGRRGRLAEHGLDDQQRPTTDHPVGGQHQAGAGLGRVPRLHPDHPVGADLGHDVVHRPDQRERAPAGGRRSRRTSGWPCPRPPP